MNTAAPGKNHPQLGDLDCQFEEIIERRWIETTIRHQLNGKIGRGRQGIVFQTSRLGSRNCQTSHALKLFDPRIYDSADDYWIDMGRISTQVSHLHATRSPHLVNCDFYEETERIGFVQMERIDGIDLSGFLSSARHRPPGNNDIFFNLYNGRPCVQPGVAIYIMRQILAGLETLHSAGYLHCDIKPSNIMIDPLGYVRVIDLGRAQRIGESEPPRIGTPHYAAPELHSGEPATVQSDLYSVGLIGLELLTGQKVFPERHPSGSSLTRRKRSLLDHLRRYLPPYVRCNQELVSILKRFLAPEPEDRFTSAARAEICGGGLATVHKQLTRMNIDSDYRRDLHHLLHHQRGVIPEFPGLLLPSQRKRSTAKPPLSSPPPSTRL
tara:strand:+ start:260 stop:1402 length:1143 start_codon:yes stop_codon:yes gene_type:complete